MVIQNRFNLLKFSDPKQFIYYLKLLRDCREPNKKSIVTSAILSSRI